ncbi:protein of unknown function [Actinopolyspora xinjiangensis]|uniref:DUF397 domain-containing protein n=1 Tax=Actinopolyspora xinjiangensis TaxID=405564 RepID=A0A1H0WGH9_9ACTN|nr:DUF397 domain-containing protein [Actinopolyspora xinjiangensis]SDP89832.1 protein of unknown function [Actinopolyspora xinjiangensis]
MRAVAAVAWRKSSHSMNQGACVEVAPMECGVAVRDSKDPAAGVLLVNRRQWTDFLAALRTP